MAKVMHESAMPVASHGIVAPGISGGFDAIAATETVKPTKPAPASAFRNRHHRIARLSASRSQGSSLRWACKDSESSMNWGSDSAFISRQLPADVDSEELERLTMGDAATCGIPFRVRPTVRLHLANLRCACSPRHRRSTSPMGLSRRRMIGARRTHQRRLVPRFRWSKGHS